MQKLPFNLLLFSLGILLYVLMILGDQPVFEKILVCEIGSAALFCSGISMLQSIKDKNEEGDIQIEKNN